MFFFEKKNQKTFIALRAAGEACAKSQKFFASFFQKRRPFFLRASWARSGRQAARGPG
jgi:hypothetical protein